MLNNSNLFVFKYRATDSRGSNINSYFKAESLDDCSLFFDTIGYKNINVTPLKPKEKLPKKKIKFDEKVVAEDFSYLYNSLKGGNTLFSSISIMLNNCSMKNKEIYLMIAYYIYKGNSLKNSILFFKDIIPKDIVDKIALADSNNLLNSINDIINIYDKKRSKGIFERLFGNKNKSTTLDIDASNNLKGIGAKNQNESTTILYPFKYKAVTELGKKVSGNFDAESIDDCIHFLELQGYTNIKVEPRGKLDIDIVLNSSLKSSDLAFDLTQLSTYIKAGIPLVEGVTILAKQTKSDVCKKAYHKLVYDLLKGYTLSVSMEKQGDVFPQLLINMVRSAELTGDLPTILDDMADYYEGVEQTKKTMRSAMTYPILVLVMAIGVLAFMLVGLVPQFISLYESNGAELPMITLLVISVSNFMQHNIVYIVIVIIISILVFYLVYKNVASFRKKVQVIAMKLPIFGNVIIYNEVYTFTKTFASLINHGVFITDSMEILSKITNNEVYKGIISKTLSNLAKGDNISKSFKNEWAFPTVAYHMLVTGENTGQLGLMMEKVSIHYQQLHKALVDQLKSLIEPLMILIVAGIVGVILLSIITPMFSIYNEIQ